MKWNHITENQSIPYHLDSNSNKQQLVLLINKCVDHITIKIQITNQQQKILKYDINKMQKKQRVKRS